ncbi:MAG TPA: FAD-dependent oxidoreductase [Caulobacteraceae bacterium]|jgi:2-polyprenyl-6-methoxyphenol hydroxylase-like FAD-dependent oxidoreductase|nr:FAD-dependent oxidoreductase [Caulobacteraceae bacterium]
MAVPGADSEVLVVGGGPVGLACAIELGTRGVRVLLVERNNRAGLAPRAKTTNVRTRTHLRRWGIADRLAEEAPFGVDYPNNMVFVTRLAGRELARFGNAFNASPERSPLYPEHAQWVPQYKLEKVLLEKARSLPGVEVRFSTRLAEATQDEEGVAAVIESEAGRQTVRCRFMVGADGARSLVRDLIGAKMEGRGGLNHAYNIIFRAPGLAQAHQHGPAAIYWQMGAQGFSAIGPMDNDDRWFFGPGAIAPGVEISKAEAAALIRERTGIDLDYEVLSADSWTASELLADRYREGRIFLAGDACHLHPPAGGYGMNMGIGDGVDLGWKMAATLQGWGGPELLDSYQTERRVVHRFVIDEAMANYAIYVAPIPRQIEDETAEGEAIREQVGAGVRASKAREFKTLGTVLGLRYSSPLIAADDETPPPHDSQVYRPSTRPGCLTPHLWLDEGVSLYDRLGAGFTLIAGPGADASAAAAALAEAQAAGIPLVVVDLADASGEGAELYERLNVLVRPDQHIAWRGGSWVAGRLAVAAGLPRRAWTRATLTA